MSFKEWTGGNCYKFDKKGGIQSIDYIHDNVFIRNNMGRGYVYADNYPFHNLVVRAFNVNTKYDESLAYPNRDSDYIKVLTQFL